MAVTTSSGDGFALYNGVKFLKMLEYDKVKYPYAYLCVYDMSSAKEEYKGESMAELRLSSMPFTAYPAEDKAKFIGTFSQALYFGINGDQLAADNANIGFVDGEWVLSFERNNMTTSATGAYITLSEITWCNRDLLNEDGSVYLPTTDPIPIDGYTVMEWDGNTEGLEVANEVHYKVSEPFDTSSALAVYSSITAPQTARVVCSEFARETEGKYYAWAVSFEGTPAVCADNYDANGLYFCKDEKAGVMSYTSLFAYKTTRTPTYDRTAFLSGMAMGLTGKGDPITGMAVSGGSDTFVKGYKVGVALRQKRVIAYKA